MECGFVRPQQGQGVRKESEDSFLGYILILHQLM